MLVDTNVSSSPIYNYLCGEGHEVYVIGANREDCLAKCAGNYISCDYSDPAALRLAIESLKIDYVVPGCNDVSYRVCATISEGRHYPGIDTLQNSEILNNKDKFRNFAIKYNLPVPRLYERDGICRSAFPVIVKPVDSFSGRGVTVVHDEDLDLLDAAIAEAKRQSRSGAYLIEEFVSGQLYSHSAFVAAGCVAYDIVVEEHCTANRFAVDTSYVVPNFPAALLGIIRLAIEKIAKTLGLKDGLFHTQFIRRGDKLWLIEPTRRCPGDLYSRLVEMSTGLNYAENYTRPFIGLKHDFSSDSGARSLVIRHTVTDPVGGGFLALRFEEGLKIREFVPLGLSGDLMKPAPAGRVGIMFVGSDTTEDFEDLRKRAISRGLYSYNQIITDPKKACYNSRSHGCVS